MSKVSRVAGLASSAAALCVAAPHAFAAVECSPDSLSALRVPNFSVSAAVKVAPDGPFPAHCNVKETVATDGEGAGPNSAGVEIKLPESWNGKFLFFGVGGLAGSLMPSANPHDVVSALGRGYATAITGAGHQGSNPFDANWIIEGPGKPNDAKVIGYFYRARLALSVGVGPGWADSTCSILDSYARFPARSRGSATSRSPTTVLSTYAVCITASR
jgi:hypothetical protein